MNTINLEAFRNSGLTGFVMLHEVSAGEQKGAAELVTTGHGAISSLITRKCNTATRQRMSYDVIAALHNTLQQRGYDQNQVNAAMTRVFGPEVINRIIGGVPFEKFGLDRVTAEQVRDVLDDLGVFNQPADANANVAAVRSALTYTASGVSMNLADYTADDGLKMTFKQLAGNLGAQLHNADQLLGTDLALNGNLAKAQNRIGDCISDIRTALQMLDNVGFTPDSQFGDMVQRLRADADRRIQALNDLMAEYDDKTLVDPVGQEAVRKCLDRWEAVGNRVIADVAGQNEAAKTAMSARLHAWMDERMERATDENAEFDFSRVVKNLKDDLKDFLSQQIKDNALVRPKKLGKRMKGYFADELNRQPWTPIKKSFDVPVMGADGQIANCKVTSEIIPAKHIKGPNGMEDPLKYGNEINGVMSHCTKEATHAVNYAETRLTVRQPDGTEKVIYAAGRHAVNGASGLSGEARTTANLNRATECVKARFLANPKLVEQALRNPGQPVKFNITSVSLLTPVDKEKDMTKDQEAAWKSINEGNPIEMTLKDKDGKAVTVKLQPHVEMFTLSSNPPAKILGLQLSSTKNVGFWWSRVEDSNKKAYANLTRRVDEFLATHAASTDPKDVKACKYVSILRSQLALIWSEKSYMLEAGGAYKASARVAMISYLMGDGLLFNCKSGKDRTSMMDAECKYLALQIEQERDIPPPGTELTESETKCYRAMVLKSGNIEMQQYNTGLGGYKAIDRAATTVHRLGRWFKRAFGASKFAKT